MTPQEALEILEDAAKTGCPGKYGRPEEYQADQWEGSVLPALSVLRTAVEELDELRKELEGAKSLLFGEGSREALEKERDILGQTVAAMQGYLDESSDKVAELKAEVESLEDDLDKVCDDWYTERGIKEKAEAELRLAEGTIEEITNAWCQDKAELEKARPLIEAVMKAGVGNIQDESDVLDLIDEDDSVNSILRAALAYRAKVEKKEKP